MGLQACLIVNNICKCFKFGTSFSSKRIHDSKESLEEVPEKIGAKIKYYSPTVAEGKTVVLVFFNSVNLFTVAKD